MSGFGLYGNGHILVLSNRFLDAVLKYATERQRESIENSIFSINHNLNIVRHNAGLIQELQAEDFEKHKEKRFTPDELPQIIRYQKCCEFRIGNFDDYLLFLIFFLEAITNGSFSLLNACGSLLNEMYDLEIHEDKVGYDEVYEKFQSRCQSDDPLVRLLEKYYADNLGSVTWIKPLRAIKNALQSRKITRVWKHNKETPPMKNTPSSHALLLKSSFFDQTKQDVIIQELVKDCFNDLDKMVTELYERLRLNLEKDEQIPLYGTIQEQVNENLILTGLGAKKENTVANLTVGQNDHTRRSRDIFGREELLDIHQLLINGNITSNPAIESLFLGMNREYCASLPPDGDPKSRLSNILNRLNHTEQLIDGELPIETFLTNAIRSISPQIQSTKLKAYLDQLRG